MEKKRVTFGVSFYLKSQNQIGDTAPIYAKITVDKKSVVVSTKKSIAVSNWAILLGTKRNRSEEMKYLHQFLDRFKSKLIQTYEDILLSGELVTAEKIKNRFLGVESKKVTFMELFDFHNKEMNHSLSWGTLKNYFTTKKYFALYLKKIYKQSDIYISELDYKFIIGFERFMKQNDPLNPNQACNQNTIMKHIERMRKLINLAIKYEWLERDPFLSFKPVFVRKERESLTYEELQRIENKQFSIPRLQLVRDLFIFSCYTGLAYIDVFNLTNNNIKYGHDGELWITTFREKSKVPVNIPLLPKAIQILERYKSNVLINPEQRVFPPLSNQKLNAYLKEIADVSSITKPLTFHIARHTFATTVTLMNGVPIETVSKLLGHTSIKTTQIYAKVLNEKISQDMKLLKMRLSS